MSLQELKAEQQAFPVKALRTLGYEAVWQGERSWNGVAILARNQVPVLTRTILPGNSEGHFSENHNLEDHYSEDHYPEDHQARYIEAAVQGNPITSIYLPNGNPQPGPKFNYKLAWFERLIAHAAELMASGAPVVLAGDYNVVPTPQDIYPTRSLDNNALIQPASRQAFARLLALRLDRRPAEATSWTGRFGHLGDYKFERWQKDKGMRTQSLSALAEFVTARSPGGSATGSSPPASAPGGRTVAVTGRRAAVTLLLGLLPGPAALLVAASVLAGAVRGVFTLTEATLVADHWGPDRYAAVNGVFNAPLTAAGALAPCIGAAIAAATGSYPALFAILAATVAAGAALAALAPWPQAA